MNDDDDDAVHGIKREKKAAATGADDT